MEPKSIKLKIIIPSSIVMAIMSIAIAGVLTYKNYTDTKKGIIEKANIALKPIVLNSNVAVSGANIMKIKSKDATTLYGASEAYTIIIKGMSNKIPKSLFAPEQPPKKMYFKYVSKKFSNQKTFDKYYSKYESLKDSAVFDGKYLIVKENLKVKNGGEVFALFDASSLDTVLSDAIKRSVILTIIALIVGNSIMLFAVSLIVKDLKLLENGLIEFFRFLNKESKSANSINLNSPDELGSMASIIDENINKIQDGIKKDEELIHEAKLVVDKVKQGVYNDTINSSTTNKELEEFKNSVNDMINTTKKHFDTMNRVLEQYSSYNYQNTLKVDGIIDNSVFALVVEDINKVKETITSMLVDSKLNGLTLQDSSNDLLQNIDSLNDSTTNAASALEETAAALDNITTNISHNTGNVIQMANYANEVTVSVSKGQTLADETAKSVDEINMQVVAINEAISVIDQIAFQTNILSLNAAVEAATAGEAGKGFAVVAQEVRNLASRSAEAANEIKSLVETATTKAKVGKSSADEMIKGYTDLNDNISKTLELISDVESESKEQQSAISQINNAIVSLEKQTQENSMVANKTKDIALHTSVIAQRIVNSVNEKDFSGKDKKDNRKKAIDLNYDGPERRGVERDIKNRGRG